MHFVQHKQTIETNYRNHEGIELVFCGCVHVYMRVNKFTDTLDRQGLAIGS